MFVKKFIDTTIIIASSLLLLSCTNTQAGNKESYTLNSIDPTISPNSYSTFYQEPFNQYTPITKNIVGKEWTYYIYDPRPKEDKAPIPALLLFHGSNRSGLSMIDKWKNLADKEKILLIAPNGKGQYWSKNLSEAMMAIGLPKEVTKEHPINLNQVYTFGHSSGANFVLYLTTSAPQNFAGMSLHAGMASNLITYQQSVNTMPKTLPISIVIGTNDPLFPLDKVINTADILAKKGNKVTVYEMDDHNHWYYDNAEQINRLAWDGMHNKN